MPNALKGSSYLSHHLYCSGLAGWAESRSLLKKGHHPLPTSKVLFKEAPLQGVGLFAIGLPLAICISESGTKSGTERAAQAVDGARLKAGGMAIKTTPSRSSHMLSSVKLLLPPQGTLCQAVRGEPQMPPHMTPSGMRAARRLECLCPPCRVSTFSQGR